MSEEQERHYGGRRPYRRRRKFQGASWTPPSMSADVGDGLWCRACKLRHGYKTLGLKYEKRSSVWYIIWNCTKTGNVVGETPLGSSSNATDGSGEAEPGRTD